MVGFVFIFMGDDQIGLEGVLFDKGLILFFDVECVEWQVKVELFVVMIGSEGLK